MTSIHIFENELSLDDVRKWVSNPESGGINIFIGDVRNHALGKSVTHLSFEAYKPMAIKEMQKIADQALEQWSCNKIAIWHRVGRLEICETAVIIAVSADHRAAAYDASRYCIDTLKETVPIWKKEFFTDGSHWVSAYP